jgi:hypothetical protein
MGRRGVGPHLPPCEAPGAAGQGDEALGVPTWGREDIFTFLVLAIMGRHGGSHCQGGEPRFEHFWRLQLWAGLEFGRWGGEPSTWAGAS